MTTTHKPAGDPKPLHECLPGTYFTHEGRLLARDHRAHGVLDSEGNFFGFLSPKAMVQPVELELVEDSTSRAKLCLALLQARRLDPGHELTDDEWADLERLDYLTSLDRFAQLLPLTDKRKKEQRKLGGGLVLYDVQPVEQSAGGVLGWLGQRLAAPHGQGALKPCQGSVLMYLNRELDRQAESARAQGIHELADVALSQPVVFTLRLDLQPDVKLAPIEFVGPISAVRLAGRTVSLPQSMWPLPPKQP